MSNPTFEFFDDHAATLRAVYKQVADDNGHLKSSDYKNHPIILALHPGFGKKAKSCLPRLGQWNHRCPQNSGLTLVRTGPRDTEWVLADQPPS